MHERYHYGTWNSDMPSDPQPAYGAVYPHRSNDSSRGNGPAYHRCWVYRFCGFRYIFRRIGGTWKRHTFIIDFPLSVCSAYHSGCTFTQQAFRSSWCLECVLDHGSDYRDPIPFHLPQGNRITHNGGRKT